MVKPGRLAKYDKKKPQQKQQKTIHGIRHKKKFLKDRRRKLRVYEEDDLGFMRAEVITLFFAAAILLFLSNFGLCGIVDDPMMQLDCLHPGDIFTDPDLVELITPTTREISMQLLN